MPEDYKGFKKVLLQALDESAKILLKNFNKNFRIGRKKDYTDLVTEIDRKSESKIIEVIHNAFPEHNILSEECGNLNLDSDYVWIIDPIDGTINYTHAVPIFCISVALEFKKELKLGAVYNPLSKEKFFSEAGRGAYLNGEKILVSKTKNLKDSLLVTGFPYRAKDNIDHCIDHFNNFVKSGLPIRRLGSAAIDLCYVACGRFDGFWEVSLNPWDVAAGYLILKESGGEASDFKGNKYSIYNKQILASNGKIHSEMIEVLQKAYRN
ncbi:MAG: inositol monophosphatase family protein [Ignavibacteria bacterium]